MKKNRYSIIRETMLHIIAKSKQPLSYFDLHALLTKKKLSANKTTIYRELTFLKEKGIIRELRFKDGISYYEIESNDHHHHTVCNTCETIDHVELEEKLILKNKKFKVLSHSLEFYGLCESCAKSIKK